MEALFGVLWISGFLVVGAGLLFLINHLLSWLGGWHTLARRHRVNALPSGETFHMQSALFGLLLSYNNALTVVITRDGVAMLPVLFLRWGHPAILLPYSAMTEIAPYQRLWQKGVTMRVDGVRIRVYRNAGKAILKAFNEWAATHPGGRV